MKKVIRGVIVREFISLCGLGFVFVITVFFLDKQLTSATRGAVFGLGFIVIVLGIVYIENKTKKMILQGLEDKLGGIDFPIAKKHIHYAISFHISLQNECPEEIKKEVLDYFKGLGIKCRVED